jgi:hypothetical protein
MQLPATPSATPARIAPIGSRILQSLLALPAAAERAGSDVAKLSAPMLLSERVAP